MKILGKIEEVSTLDRDLSELILKLSPWITEGWQPEQIGFIFILDDSDIQKISKIHTTPHIQPSGNDHYKQLMTIDLETYDLWEPPAIQDQKTGYWNIVAILGQEFGCSVFMSAGYVSSLPTLQTILQNIQEKI